jgi:enediyne biosynthesis protein E4
MRHSGPYRRSARIILSVGLLAASAVLGASHTPSLPAATQSRSASPQAHVTFTDVTTQSGIRFRHHSGAFGKKYLPETMGSGVIVFDADGDGAQDLFFVNSKSWPGQPAASALPALYRNAGNGTFTDVTRQAGLAHDMYGMGGAAADFDNDGDTDLFVTALGGNRLYRNAGKGTFEDVTSRAGVAAGEFPTSAAWVDYDKDGRLDLYVCNYVVWSIQTDRFCSLDGKTKSYCTPEAYQGASPRLFRNRGDGTFEDATKRAGLLDPSSKALGIALLDYNGDGWLDLFVANDTQPNRLYRNTGKGTFVDEAVPGGVAFNDAGVARAGMGTDAADYDGSGRPSLVVGNFSNEMIALYHNEGSSLFIDAAPSSTVGQASLQTLTFACFFFDYDLDGLPDIFAANGHVADDINRAQPKIAYQQRPHLFRNAGNERFDVVSQRVGPAFQTPVVARGAAYLDADRDGDLDLVITTNNGPARLLRNDGGNRHRWLRVQLAGMKSNRSAIGARVTVTLEGGRKIWGLVKTGSSYLSQSEMPLTFGLGANGRVTALQVDWPSGATTKAGALETNRTVTIVEGQPVK